MTRGAGQVAVGDQTIRVWNTGHPTDLYDCTSLWRGLQTKVTCVKWHPVADGRLGFALDDGRVGVYDTFSGRFRMLPGRHAGTVYQLAWRALPASGAGAGAATDEGAVALLSCGADGQVAPPTAPVGLTDFDQRCQTAGV